MSIEIYTKAEMLEKIEAEGVEYFFRWCVSVDEIPDELKKLVKAYKKAALKLEVAVSKYGT